MPTRIAFSAISDLKHGVWSANNLKRSSYQNSGLQGWVNMQNLHFWRRGAETLLKLCLCKTFVIF